MSHTEVTPRLVRCPACGGDSDPTPTPTKTPLPVATPTIAPTPTAAPAAANPPAEAPQPTAPPAPVVEKVARVAVDQILLPAALHAHRLAVIVHLHVGERTLAPRQ